VTKARRTNHFANGGRGQRCMGAPLSPVIAAREIHDRKKMHKSELLP